MMTTRDRASAGAPGQARGASRARQPAEVCSAYAWQRFALWLHQKASPHTGIEHNAWSAFNDTSDDGRVTTERMRTQGVQHRVRYGWSDADDRFPFVGDVQRIDAEQFAHRPRFVGHGHGGCARKAFS